MPGPTPKPAAQRQRRNKSSTASTLRAVPGATVPELPEREWHPLTVSWWQDIWVSPMAPEYLDADRHGLFVLAMLVDDFWREPSKEVAAEIRLQRQCFGLTPIDRRRLEWHVEQGEEAAARTAERRKTRRPRAGGKDPRDVLALAK